MRYGSSRPGVFMTWQQGDWAILSGHGLCSVVDLLGGDGVVVRVDSATERLSGEEACRRLRRPVDRDRACALLRRVQEAPPDRRPWKERLANAKRVIVQGSPEELATTTGQFIGIFNPTFQEQNWRVKLENVLLPEIAHVLGVPPSDLRTRVRRVLDDERTAGPNQAVRPSSSDGPQVAGHVWLGAFAIRGAMVLGQPNYLGADHDLIEQHNLMLPARPGTWHAFRRMSRTGDPPRFVVVHDGALADAEYMEELARPLGKLLVPDGVAAVMDAVMRAKEEVRTATRNRGVPEGVCFPWGMAGGLHAPGAAQVLGIRTGGTLSWVCIDFVEEDDSDLPTDVSALPAGPPEHHDEEDEDDLTDVEAVIPVEPPPEDEDDEDLPTAPQGAGLPEAD